MKIRLALPVGLALLTAASLASGAEELWILSRVQHPSELHGNYRPFLVKNMLAVMESKPDDPYAKKLVGNLLYLRGELRGELATRAAANLEAVTGQKHGNDFDAWSKWFESVRAEPEWSPLGLERTVANPRRVHELELLIWSPKITDERDGWKALQPPIVMNCPARGFYAEAEGPVRVRFDPKGDGQLEIDGPIQTWVGATITAPSMRLERVTMNLRSMRPRFMDRASVTDATQEADEAKLTQVDLGRVLDYVYAEARKGNFLPLGKLFRWSSEAAGTQDKLRADIAGDIGLSREEAQQVPLDELAARGLSSRFQRNAAEVINITVEAPGDGTATVRRGNPHHSGTSKWLRRDGRWLFEIAGHGERQRSTTRPADR